MENITTSYLSRAELWLCITTLIYFMMNGAQIFETLLFVPKWTVSPPDNFKLLIDGQGSSLKIFWIVFHSLHEITFCWRCISVGKSTRYGIGFWSCLPSTSLSGFGHFLILHLLLSISKKWQLHPMELKICSAGLSFGRRSIISGFLFL